MNLPRLIALAAALLLAGSASAQQREFNFERLRLDPSARGSLVLPGGEVLPALTPRLSLSLHYEREPLALTNEGTVRGRGFGAEDDKALDLMRNRLTLHVGGALGITHGLEAVAEMPVIVRQSLDVAGTSRAAAAAPRFGLRLGSAAEKPLSLAVSVEAKPKWGHLEAFEGEEGWTFYPGVGATWRLGPAAVLANVTGLIRTEKIDLTQGEQLGNEVQAGLGVATTGSALRVELTARGGYDLEDDGTSAEVLAGLRLIAGAVEVYALGGPGFIDLAGTPQWRGLVGIALAPGAKAAPAAAAAPVVAPAPAPAPAAPPPPAQVDPCAPGQTHTPEQCPALDDDGDGVANADDKCPTEKGIPQAGGCPAKDSDGDGVADHEDRCPDQKGVAENGGCPPADSDGDGIPDAQDKCPQQPGVAAEQGCPPARAQINVQTGKIDIKEKVFFESGKATIQQRSFKLLDDVAALLVANPKVGKVVVEGHTDDRGPAELNRKLSAARAEAVKDYLVKKGVEAARLEAKGLGPDRPAQSNDTAAGRDANRRVEFVIAGQ